MAYRPHFAYRTPDGFTDERAQYPFDYRQAPGATALAFGKIQLNIPLRLDSDSRFMWRGISWEYPDTVFFLCGQIAIRIRDCFGNYLSSDFVPILNYAQGSYVLQPWSGVSPPDGPFLTAPFAGGMSVAFPDEIECPPSGVIQFDILGISSLNAGNVGRFMVRGVKRRPSGDCDSRSS